MIAPLLSIITVNYNNKSGLIRTLNSIKNQESVFFEHIIIDANSTDGSKDAILLYEKEITFPLYWVSEPDNGIYDGMNKGIKQAHGDYLFFLNSGDTLISNTILQEIALDGNKYIYGNIKYILSEKDYRYITPSETLDIVYLLKTALPHQACFIHHSLFQKQLYNTEYKIISDWIHTMESIIFNDCSYKYIDIVIAEVDGNGISTNQEKLMEERIKWIKSKFPKAILDALSELYEYRISELAPFIQPISQTKKFKKRIRKLISFLLKINNIISHKKRIEQKKNEIWTPFN